MYPLFILLCVLLGYAAQAQPHPLIGEKGFEAYEVPVENTTISYIVGKEQATQKGFLVFFQGSMPTPLIIQGSGYSTTVLPFAYEELAKEYRLVLISKPGIPVCPSTTQLDKYYNYKDQNGALPATFMKHNHLDFYVKSTEEVCRALEKKWPKLYKQEVVLVGHSQGAKIAVKSAKSVEATALVYLSANPMGRFDELIRRKREDELCGRITSEEAQEAIAQYYDKWASICAQPESVSMHWKDSYKTWTSFSEETRDDLLALNIPVMVAYGSLDVTARACDLLPLDFIRAGKKNLYHKVFPGVGHNFFKHNAEGQPDFEQAYWPEVIHTVRRWLAVKR